MLGDQKTSGFLRRVAVRCGAAAALLGFLGFLGWILGSPLLDGIRPEYFPMAPATGLAFMFLGAILALHTLKPQPGWGGILSLALAGLVTVFGLLEFVEYFIEVDLTYEELLFPIQARFGTVPLYQISPMAGGIFSIAGLALLLLLRPGARSMHRHLAGVLGSLVGGAGFIVTLAYLFGIPLLYGSGMIPLAPTTAIAFLSLGSGLVAATGPEGFPLRLLVGPGFQTKLLRFVLPLVVIAIILHGLAQKFITGLVQMNYALLTALVAMLFAAITAVLVTWMSRVIAQNLDRALGARDLAEAESRSLAQKWRSTFNAIGDAVCLLNREAIVVQCNQAMVDLVGKPFIEILGHHCWDLVQCGGKPLEGCPLQRLWQSRSRETMTYPLGDRWLHGMVDPILNEAGEITGGVLIIADITSYKRAEDKIKDLNTLLRAIKEINEALLRVKSEPELFKYICDVMVKVPYVRFTWIGLVEAGSFEVKPVAWAGIEDGYLASVRVTWDESSHGQGPAGTAIRTRQATEVGDIDADPRFLPWRREARQRGYASGIALPLVHLGETLGALSVYSGNKHAFGEEELGFFTQVAGDIAVGIRSLRLERELERSLGQLLRVGEQTVEAIASMAELRDPYTAGHQRKVSRLACALAAEMGLPDETVAAIRVAGFLHDIGKIVVPAEILNKPGKLSQYEMSLIRTHSQAGCDILQKIDFPWPIAQIVLQHHERLDGSGYPAGLTAADILLEAKILAVADVVEAMASFRPYRPALGLDLALAEITKNEGVLYDPAVVAACVRLFSLAKFRFAA
jgi:putative nucleotidyltransferase with HDIG domain/PAS domain S-box-containing protein